MRKDTVTIDVCGYNLEGVSGSMSYMRAKDCNILVEAGLFQSQDILEEYKVNNRKLPFSVKGLDYIVIGHVHADHCLLIPRLVKEGFSGKILMPKGCKNLFKYLAMDSAKIISKDVLSLKIKYGKSFRTLYTEEDVDKSLELIEELEFNVPTILSPTVSLEFKGAGHIIASGQMLFYIKKGACIKKVLFTSDLGNPAIKRLWVSPFDLVEAADIVIGESTYGASNKSVTEVQRFKDIERLKNVIKSNNSLTLLPLFALDRSVILLDILYSIFGEDESFKRPIYLDSPLAIKLLFEYLNISKEISDEWYERLNKIVNWENLHLVESNEESMALREDPNFAKSKPIILASSGMLCKGRAYFWLKKYISNSEAYVVFTGYSTEGSLASKLKNLRNTNKVLTLDNHKYKVKCNCVELKSFSGHAQKLDLLKYYSTIRAEKIYLVHGSREARKSLITSYANEAEKCKNPNKYKARLIAMDKSVRISV